jgi:glycolate oxidase
VYVARTEDEAEALWTARRGLSPAIRRLGFPDKISEDICVPRHALPDAVQEVERIGRRNELTVLTFGHAGDGNLHVNVLLDRGNPSERNRGETAVREIMEATLALGGTISGEHGIGLTKQAFMPMEVAPRGLEIMKAIKRAFDPNNIMNPGKMFPCG